MNGRFTEVEVSVEEVDLWCSSVSVGLERETVVKVGILDIHIYDESIFEWPEEDVPALEVNVPVFQFSPVHHDSSLLLIDCELCACGVDGEVRDLDVSDLEEAEDKADLLGDQRCDDIVDDGWELIEELILDQVEETLL